MCIHALLNSPDNEDDEAEHHKGNPLPVHGKLCDVFGRVFDSSHDPARCSRFIVFAFCSYYLLRPGVVALMFRWPLLLFTQI